MDGVCELYQMILESDITVCSLYEPFVGDYSLEDHLEYDFELVEEGD